ncbi:MAG: hypothetical protein IJS28_07055 [Synergistaceae bacterium]|nr:hypothetical protein [Synergistaceae bacterium]
MKLLRALRRLFTRREVVHFIPRLPVGLELSDGDREALYGEPERAEAENEQQLEH